MQRNVIIFLLAYFLSPACLGQEYPFVHYTPKDGLANSRVRKAYQDSRWRMYFLTYGGLSVYDGSKFRNYTMQNGLASDMVNDILELGDDSLLVAVNTNQVHLLIHGELQNLKSEDHFSPLINQFLKSKDGTVYASSDNGLFYLSPKGFRKLPLTLAGKNSDLIFLGTLVEFHDYLLMTTNDLKNYTGLYLYNKKTMSISDAFEKTTVYFLGKDPSGQVWVSLPNRLMMLDSQALQQGKLRLRPPILPLNRSNKLQVVDLHFDGKTIWVNEGANEIIRINEGSELHLRIPEPEATLGMRSFFTDKEGNIWICNDGAGVFKLANSGLQILDRPFENTVHRVFSKADTSWFSSVSNKLFRKTSSGVLTLSGNVSPSPLIMYRQDNKIVAADERNIYKATYPEQDEKSLFFKKQISFPNNRTFGKKMLSDPNGNLITSFTEGILVLKNFQVLFKYPLQEADFVEGLQLDRSGRLWMASRERGLVAFSLHPENPSQYLQPVFTFPDLPDKMSPRCMIIDKQGWIWVGSRIHGLAAFSLEGGILKTVFHFRRNNGLTDDFVTSLACDSANDIIVGTQTGIDRIIQRKNNYFIENITRSCNYFTYINQVWTSGDNSAHALGANGALIQAFAPPEKTGNESPQLYLEEVKMNGQKSELQKRIYRYDENNISLSLAAPTFIDEKAVKFSYLLDGAGNNRWTDTTGNSIINLINLRPAKYRLAVKAFFPGTSYPPKELFYAFTITAPWWQTAWFRLGIALLLLLGLGLALRAYYRQKLSKQQTELDKQHAIQNERTRIATDMHDDLGAGLSTIRFLSEKVRRNIFSRVSRDDIDKMQSTSNELIDKMNEIIWAMSEKNDSLEDLLFYTRSYAKEYCEDNGLDCIIRLPETIPSKFVSGELRRNIFLTVKESLHNIVKHASATLVDINIEASRNLDIAIRDNGKGFQEDSMNGHGNGLRNMQQRIESIGGEMRIQNGNGVTIRLNLPLR